MNFEIVKLTSDKYVEWNKFCLESDDAWFWHTTDWLEYSLNYKPELKSRALSFMVCDDTGIIGLCPLILEELPLEGDKIIKEFSNYAGGGYGATPALKNGLTENRKEALLKKIFDHIDKLALENDVKRVLFRFSSFTKGFNNSQPPYNYLMKFNFFDNSLNTQIIDIGLPEEKLFGDVRKGHKHDIKRGERAYSIEIFDKDDIKEDIFKQYRLLHHKAAGRITRSLATFEMMYRWIREGKGILCGARHNNKYIGFSLVIVYKQCGFYASSSDDPDIEVDVPISHVIQWEIINWLKGHGIMRYEIGLQQFGPQIYDCPTKKDLDISFFKRGFGGHASPYIRGEKFYDKEYAKLIFGNRVARLCDTIGNIYLTHKQNTEDKLYAE
jgi:hypothetical protein